MKKIIKLLILIVMQLLQETSTESNSVTCNYAPKIYNSHGTIATCFVKTSPKIHEENVTVEFFHDTDSQSDALEISNKEYFYIPIIPKEYFPHLRCLTIRHSKLKKVNSENLKQFTDLEYLDLSNNELSILEPHLFQHNPNLTTIWLSNNSIYFIDPTAVVALKKIHFFNFYDNACYSFLSRNHQELMIDHKVSLCSIRLPKIYTEIAEVSLKLSSQNEAFLNNLTSIQAEFFKNMTKFDEQLHVNDEDSEAIQNHFDDDSKQAILSSLVDLQSTFITNLSEKVNKANVKQLQDIKAIMEEVMDKRYKKDSILIDKHLIYIAGACILIIFMINTIFFYCIISYIKSLKPMPQNVSNPENINNNHEKIYQNPIKLQSDEARPNDIPKMSDEYEEILHLNEELDVQPEESLYSEVAVPLENLLQKTDENDENSQLYAVVLKN